MKNFIILPLFLMSLMIFSQTLPLDFEVAEDDGFVGFNGTNSSVVADPTDASNQVLEFQGGTNQWDGASINLATYVDLSDDANNTVTFDMWVPAGSSGNHLLKFEGGSSGATELFFNTSASDDWETITVDFPTGLGNEYPILTLFTDCTNAGDNTTSATYYFDNINGPNGAAVPVPEVPSTAAPVPTTPDATVLSIYNDVPGYTNVWTPDYDFGTDSGDVDLSGNMAKLVNLAAAGWGQGTNGVTDISMYNYLQFDYWADSMTDTFTFFLMHDNGGVVEFTYKIGESGQEAITNNEWVHVEIPLTYFEGLGFSKAHFHQWKLDKQSNNAQRVYLDNIYFSMNPLSVEDLNSNDAGVTLYPNPVQAGMNFYLQSDNEEVAQVSVFNREGKLVKTAMNADEISTQGLDKGVYILTIETVNGNIENEKLIVR